MEDFEVSPYQVDAVVSDNGANIVKACETLHEKYAGWHVQCAAHSLQLCVKDGLQITAVKVAIRKSTFH